RLLSSSSNYKEQQQKVNLRPSRTASMDAEIERRSSLQLLDHSKRVEDDEERSLRRSTMAASHSSVAVSSSGIGSGGHMLATSSSMGNIQRKYNSNSNKNMNVLDIADLKSVFELAERSRPGKQKVNSTPQLCPSLWFFFFIHVMFKL
ncbi:hypothetical protein DOY81_012325, partial [Sarcophaga bullata]